MWNPFKKQENSSEVELQEPKLIKRYCKRADGSVIEREDPDYAYYDLYNPHTQCFEWSDGRHTETMCVEPYTMTLNSVYIIFTALGDRRKTWKGKVIEKTNKSFNLKNIDDEKELPLRILWDEIGDEKAISKHQKHIIIEVIKHVESEQYIEQKKLK